MHIAHADFIYIYLHWLSWFILCIHRIIIKNKYLWIVKFMITYIFIMHLIKIVFYKKVSFIIQIE